MKTIPRFSPAGFTLIELLVVIGLIAILAAGIGLAIKDNNPSSALRSAQGLTLSALSSARGQAALTQQTAKLIIQADKDKDNFLRLVKIVISPDGMNWKQAGGDIILPQGVYIVPNSTVQGLTVPSGSPGRKSTFLTSASTVPGIPTNDSNSWLSSGSISSLGVITGSAGNIVVATGQITGPGAVILDNYESRRGLSVSRYGVATLVNEATSFGP